MSTDLSLMPGKKSRLTILTLSVAVLLTAFVAVAQEQQIGYVLNLRGKWILKSSNSSEDLGSGSPVTAGGFIELVNRSGGELIEIGDMNGKPIKIVNCSTVRCDRSFQLPNAVHTNILFRIFGAAMEMLRSKPPLPLKPAISRGPELNESVVKLAGEQIDLTSVLSNMRRGRYLLRFEPQGAGTSSKAEPIGLISIDWDPTKRAAASVKGLTPGLYIVQPLSNEDREPLEPGSESMVLFVRPEIFEKDFREFSEAVKLTNSWGERVRHDSKRQFLRAVLAKLGAEAP